MGGKVIALLDRLKNGYKLVKTGQVPDPILALISPPHRPPRGILGQHSVHISPGLNNPTVIPPQPALHETSTDRGGVLLVEGQDL